MARNYWWIRCYDAEADKDYLLFGSSESEMDARQKGLELLGNVDFEIKPLPTRDLGRASALWRGRKLEKTHSLSQSTKRLGHEKSLKRALNKKKKPQFLPEWLRLEGE